MTYTHTVTHDRACGMYDVTVRLNGRTVYFGNETSAELARATVVRFIAVHRRLRSKREQSLGE